ncbi:hypothetical protein [Solidesulfovibrio sp.]
MTYDQSAHITDLQARNTGLVERVRILERVANDQESVYRRALDAFGADAQIDMAIEEGAELTVELMHRKRGRQHNAPEEIADVLITAGQMRLLFGAEAVDAILVGKLADLEQRIDGAKG